MVNVKIRALLKFLTFDVHSKIKCSIAEYVIVTGICFILTCKIFQKDSLVTLPERKKYFIS
jgi:hypothetical protein